MKGSERLLTEYLLLVVAGAVLVADDAFTAALGFDGAGAAALVVAGFLLKKLKIIFNLIGLECPE